MPFEMPQGARASAGATARATARATAKPESVNRPSIQ